MQARGFDERNPTGGDLEFAIRRRKCEDFLCHGQPESHREEQRPETRSGTRGTGASLEFFLGTVGVRFCRQPSLLFLTVICWRQSSKRIPIYQRSAEHLGSSSTAQMVESFRFERAAAANRQADRNEAAGRNAAPSSQIYEAQ